MPESAFKKGAQYSETTISLVLFCRGEGGAAFAFHAFSRGQEPISGSGLARCSPLFRMRHDARVLVSSPAIAPAARDAFFGRRKGLEQGSFYRGVNGFRGKP